jgi:hypothetical protein
VKFQVYDLSSVDPAEEKPDKSFSSHVAEAQEAGAREGDLG